MRTWQGWMAPSLRSARARRHGEAGPVPHTV